MKSNHYHAHVYYNDDEVEKARKIHVKAEALSGSLFKTWRFFSKRVGPHHLPMFEIHFFEDTKTAAIEWIEKNREGLSVLIHHDTGDDYKDHDKDVVWLGEKLPIHFEFFDAIQQDPNLVIHKKN